MMTLLNIGAVLLGLAALLLLAQGGAGMLTEKPLFNFKPFNCHACLTFWLTLALLFAALALFRHFELRTVIDALIFAFINYFYIKTKINIYE